MVMFGGVVPGTNSTSVAANSSLLTYSDYAAIDLSGGVARFTRPITDIADTGGRQYVNPGARCSFRSDAKVVNVYLAFNTSQPAASARASKGLIQVNGSVVQEFSSPAGLGVSTSCHLQVINATSADRLYEVLMPWGQSVDFVSVQVDTPYVVTQSAARTGARVIVYGDSRAGGYYQTGTAQAWWYKLAEAKGWQCTNMGYAGRLVTPGDGTILGGMTCSKLIVMIDYNDFAAQVALATFKSSYKSFLTNFHTLNPTADIYCISSLWTSTSLAIPIASYRTQESDAVTELGWSQLHFINGLSLTTNAGASFFDGIHPNDTGSSEIAAALPALIP
jgi:hypothetical protein